MESELPQYVNDVKMYFSLLKESINIFKSAKELLPDSPEKDILSKSIEEAEMKAKVAEAGMAKSLGFVLCPKCWPPSILKATAVHGSVDMFNCNTCDTHYANHGKRRGVVNLREYDPNQN